MDPRRAFPSWRLNQDDSHLGPGWRWHASSVLLLGPPSVGAPMMLVIEPDDIVYTSRVERIVGAPGDRAFTVETIHHRYRFEPTRR
jgi:hypothetical protein